MKEIDELKKDIMENDAELQTTGNASSKKNEFLETSVDELMKTRYIMFFYSRSHLNFKMLKDFSEKNEWLYQEGEYMLDEPSAYYKGAPCYIVFKDENISTKWKFNQAKNVLVEQGYSPQEIKAKLHSAYLQRIHNFKVKFYFKYAVMWFMSMVIAIMSTVFVCQSIFT